MDKPSNTPAPLDGVGILPVAEPAASLAPLDPEQPYVEPPLEPEVAAAAVPLLFIRSYILLAAALLLSAIVAHSVALSPRSGDVFIGAQLLFIFEVIAVGVLARYVPGFSTLVSALILLFFALFNGISFSAFLSVIPHDTVAYGFLVPAITFATTALIARTTHIDLGSLRGYALLLSVGLVITVLLTWSLSLTEHYWATACIGTVIFTGLAGYFSDDIRYFNLELEDREGWKSSICAALVIFLNFVNVYLITMRLITSNTSSNSQAEARRRLRM